MKHRILGGLTALFIVFHNADGKFMRVTGVEPELGRGYSISSNVQYPSCQTFASKTAPAMNYDFYWIKPATNTEADVNSALSNSKAATSMSLDWLIEELNFDKVKGCCTQHIILILAFEQRGISYDEAAVTMKPQSLALLTTQLKKDLITFFQSCGPGYVRSIQKSAELAVLFAYPTMDNVNTPGFYGSIITDVESAASQMGSTDSPDDISALLVDKFTNEGNLRIRINAIGLAPSGYNTGFMLENTIPGLIITMRHAFESMRQDLSGKVTGVEVVPWTDHPTFRKNLSSDLLNNQVPSSLFLYEYFLSTNAEFIASIGEVMKKKLDDLNVLMRCQREASSLAAYNANRIITNSQQVGVGTNGVHNCQTGNVTLTDAGTEITAEDKKYMHVGRLNLFLNNGFTGQYTNNLKSWIDGFYSPCMNGLETDLGTKMYTSIAACNKIGCLRHDFQYDSDCSVDAESTNYLLLLKSYCPVSLTTMTCV